MITESYYSEKESMISPGAFLGERKYICDTAIATFSNEIFEAVLEKFPHKEVGHNANANGHRPIYLIEADGMKLIFYMTSIGAALAGTDIIEMQWQTGVKNIIMTGSAGAPMFSRKSPPSTLTGSKCARCATSTKKAFSEAPAS